jgi:hypothetical protein
MVADIKLNVEQALYVIPCGTGYSCLGFDVCLSRNAAYVDWANRVGMQGLVSIRPEQRGTLEAYAIYRANIDRISANHAVTGLRCDAELTPQLIGLEGKRVEVVTSWGETMSFYVGRSMGFIPVHLEIERRDSTGGGAVCGAPFKSVRVVGQR